jgi:hypothetical protein
MHLSKRFFIAIAAAFVMTRNSIGVSAFVGRHPSVHNFDIQIDPDDTERLFFKKFLQQIEVSGIAMFYTPDISKEDETIDAIFGSAISTEHTVPNYNETDFIMNEHRRFHFSQDRNGSLKMQKKIYLVLFCNEIVTDVPTELRCIARVAKLQTWTSSFKGKENFLIQSSVLNYSIRARDRMANLWYLENFLRTISRSLNEIGNVVQVNLEHDRDHLSLEII